MLLLFIAVLNLSAEHKLEFLGKGVDYPSDTADLPTLRPTSFLRKQGFWCPLLVEKGKCKHDVHLWGG